jgi:UDP-glucose 4-epimerase
MPPWEGKRVLVTGGAGFIGSHLVDALLAEGARVTVLDNLHSGQRANLRHVADRIAFVEGDVRDEETVAGAVRGQEVVFHLAANADVPQSVKDPRYDFESNVVGSYHVWRACLAAGVGRVVFASSAAVYGEPRYRPIDEEHPLRPISPYGSAKVAGEALGFAYHRTYGLPFTALRIFNSYGERLSRYVIFDLLAKLERSPDVLEVLGDGRQVRDYCHVADTCRAFLAAAQCQAALGEAINVAGGAPITIAELVALLLRLLHLEGRTQVRYTGTSWQGDIQVLHADTSKAQRLLGFRPQVPLADGISRLIAWLRRERGWTFGLSS